ncbi:hypothetical protein NVS55_21805 [Myxococcus stipitatus]|uniref:hypothetical protein n=1 Tax=Myxococcus stipitatus TaxID=83455 RepID=UPI00314544C1
MSDTRIAATLTYTGTATPPSSAQVPVDASGLVVALAVPEGVSLVRAALKVRAPADDVTLNLAPTSTLATSDGQTTLDPAKAITWLSLDWGVRRPLSSVELKLVTTTPVQTAKKGRLSVAEGGSWYPPTPSDTVATNAVEVLPGLLAGRLLVEFVEASAAPPPVGTPKTLSATQLQSITLRAPARPPDLTAFVGEGAGTLFFHHSVPMLPRQELVMEDALSDALQRAWPAKLQSGTVAIALRSSGLGMFDRVQLVLDTLDVIEHWSAGTRTQTLTVGTDGMATAQVSVPKDRPLTEVRFQVRHQLNNEHLPLAPRPPGQPPLAHHCGSDISAAQSFGSKGAVGPLAALDLHLRPLTRKVTGVLTLHADAHGRPDATPLPTGPLTFQLEEEGTAPWSARWVSFTLEKPLALGTGTWWAVLSTTEGAVLWSLTDFMDEGSTTMPGPTLHRIGALSPWLPHEATLPGTEVNPQLLWACSRPRLRPLATEPPPRPRLQLRWGTRTLDVTPDEDGLVALDARALAPLTPPGGTGSPPPLEVLVRSAAAGDITLSELHVVIPRRETHALFPHS